MLESASVVTSIGKAAAEIEIHLEAHQQLVQLLLLMDTPAAAVDYGYKVSTKHGAIHSGARRAWVMRARRWESICTRWHALQSAPQ